MDKTKLAVTGTVADGKVLKLSGSSLIWGDDIVGSPGTSYTADGSSLALSGTTFSVKDAGIGTTKIAEGAVTGAKIAPNAVAFGRIADGGIPASKFQMPLSLSGGFGNQAVIKAVDSGGIGFGLWGESTTSTGVYGKATAGDGVGVHGASDTNAGVVGEGAKYGVFGASSSGYGVYGDSSHNNAVYGVTVGSDTNATAIAGTSPSGYAAYFEAGKSGGGFNTCTFHAGTTGWSCTSDRNHKENFKPVNTAQVLEALAKMPVTTWNMKGYNVRQMGPTAQDFHAAFNLGTSDKSINNTDAQGVALAAIKGLYQENRALKGENRALEDRLATLEARFKALEQSVRSK